MLHVYYEDQCYWLWGDRGNIYTSSQLTSWICMRYVAMQQSIIPVSLNQIVVIVRLSLGNTTNIQPKHSVYLSMKYKKTRMLIGWLELGNWWACIYFFLTDSKLIRMLTHGTHLQNNRHFLFVFVFFQYSTFKFKKFSKFTKDIFMQINRIYRK